MNGKDEIAKLLPDFFREMQKIGGADDATEHSYRPALEKLLTAAAGKKATVINEPARKTEFGAPDFRASDLGGGIVGYVECKQPGANLNDTLKSEQIRRYQKLTSNLLVTDGLLWIHLRGNSEKARARIGEIGGNFSRSGANETAILLRDFFDTPPLKVANAKELADALAKRCVYLRDFLREEIQRKSDLAEKLRGLYGTFCSIALRDLDKKEFADAFSQTLIYGLFLARLNAPTGKPIDLPTIDINIPRAFALIREMVVFLRDLGDAEHPQSRWIVEEALAVVNGMDIAAIKQSLSFSRNGESDPYIYFYEEFLKSYDPLLRERRGVYYTPPEVVHFIVGAVESVLRDDFQMPRKLADERVTVLDFAAGTGTFLAESIRRVLNGKGKSERRLLMRDHILTHFHGFEYLIAPYTIAHLKLSQLLRDSECELRDRERLGVYLTNTLEPVDKTDEIPHVLPALARETKNAQRVKDNPVLVITGNPPYSYQSQNTGEWIQHLIKDYYQVNGASLGERNPRGLQDDYVKFIRFAQWKMDNSPEGIVAVITNHAFLDNVTFRGMRQSLMQTFNRLYFLDLHGNARQGERTPDGGKDENVFDIQQGVAVSIMVKKEGLPRGVYHADLWGIRAHKYAECIAREFNAVKWQKVASSPPCYLFIPRNEKMATHYETFPSIKDIFPVNSVGIVTARDKLTIHFTANELRQVVHDFADLSEAKAREKYNLGKDSRDWKVKLAQKDLRDSNLDDGKIVPINYRPFDIRHTYYTGNSRGFYDRPFLAVMRHMLAEDNLGLISVRQQSQQGEWSHVGCTKTIMESCAISNKTKEMNYLFPLYLLPEGKVHKDDSRRENIAPAFRRRMNEAVGGKPSPEQILGYIYAILHSPTYRKKYADFLRADFPRIPLPPDAKTFNKLAKLGDELIAAHLRRKIPDKNNLAKYKGDGNNEVTRITYSDADGGKAQINATQYFAPIPEEVWEFQIGGYYPLQKYLKSRKGRTLDLSEIRTLENAANAIAFTIFQMPLIDKSAAEWI